MLEVWSEGSEGKALLRAQGEGGGGGCVHQEQIVDVGDVAGGGGRAILLEQPHQVPELAVQVAEDLDGRCAAHLPCPPQLGPPLAALDRTGGAACLSTALEC